jgi:hypothetical protein
VRQHLAQKTKYFAKTRPAEMPADPHQVSKIQT